MTGPWDEFENDPRRTENANLRASDRDRDVVRRQLVEAYASGRLDRAEFDERADQALTVRTLGQIPAMVEDLVATSARTLESTSIDDRALQAYSSERKTALWQFLSVSAICWVIWFAVSGGQWSFPWPLFVMLGTGLNAARVIYMRTEMIEQKKRSLQKHERKALEREQRSIEPPDVEE